MSKQLRIVYAIGTEDVIEAYKCWKEGSDVGSQVSITFSSYFYSVCTALDAVGYVIGLARKTEVVYDGRFIIERRRVLLYGAKGVFYHVKQILQGIQLFISAISFGANVVIADSGTTYWFMLLPLSWIGVKVIPSLHCTLWRKYSKQTLGEKIILNLSRDLFYSRCHSIHAVSYEITQQITVLTNGVHPPIYEFLPIYNKNDFADIPPPPQQRLPLRVLFAGRVEYDKGAFDLLLIAKRIAATGIKNIIFDICGDGAALQPLQTSVKKEGVEDLFVFHGYCGKQKMRSMFGKSHVVIVPTRTDFIEGFNRVVAEGVLSGRPVITSAVCPALSYVREAVIEVLPNDIEAYVTAILQIYNDPIICEQKRLACFELQEQFYDINKSWATALASSLCAIQELLSVEQPNIVA
ncbi:MAG: glycosyltransferase family 4 protein [Calothrix sp. FI2-JRJ7]|jgi:glycosyltransferase involved in cell wall biosynthesis|nr:glycosyltransferase family 4 protein [Calothrix sp. FI2-JRJ7]